MDPNYFNVDGERLYEVLLAIVVLSFVLERALSLIFEHKIFVEKLAGKGIKEVIAFAVAFIVCRKWDFDAVSVMLVSETTNGLGHAITAGVIAGGSKSSVKLFHDVMGTYSSAEKEYKDKKKKDGGNPGASPKAESPTPGEK
jgi:hypothetical protein